jgi:hypothetical protein
MGASFKALVKNRFGEKGLYTPHTTEVLRNAGLLPGGDLRSRRIHQTAKGNKSFSALVKI